MEWVLPAIAVSVLAFAAVSRKLDGTSITAPMVFTAAGLVGGAKVAGLVDPSPAGTTVKLLASATSRSSCSETRHASISARSERSTTCPPGSWGSGCR
jgi:hypothetical protein